MRTSHKLTSMLLTLVALFAFAATAFAQVDAVGPGAVAGGGRAGDIANHAVVSDQIQGSVLIYNIYTSNSANPGAENTRINITNTSNATAYVHFFFLDGSNCSVADSFLCLTGNQTMAFNMSDTDPGITGYVVAVATDRQGRPISNNYLIGDEYVKFSSGHAANLGAEAIAAISAPAVLPNEQTANIQFNGVNYGLVGRVLAIDHLMNQTGDGNQTRWITNRITGSLVTGISGLSAAEQAIFGILYDAVEAPYSFTGSVACQRIWNLNQFPRTTPNVATVIPPGSYGWLKFWANHATVNGILGAVINYNPNANNQSGAYNGGHNLHKLTFTTTASYTIPVFPAGCQ